MSQPIGLVHQVKFTSILLTIPIYTICITSVLILISIISGNIILKLKVKAAFTLQLQTEVLLDLRMLIEHLIE